MPPVFIVDPPRSGPIHSGRRERRAKGGRLAVSEGGCLVSFAKFRVSGANRAAVPAGERCGVSNTDSALWVRRGFKPRPLRSTGAISQRSGIATHYESVWADAREPLDRVREGLGE